MFPTDLPEILAKIDKIDPIAYGKTRNFSDGAVTRLSPYLSRGVISTRQILLNVLKRGYQPHQIETFIKELAWRDYYQQVWTAKGDAIFSDLRQPQEPVKNYEMPVAILEAQTGIEAIDEGIKTLYETGYIHNHLRMYLAGITCNMAYSYWKMPAKWMYYHLLDADLASNTCSWQWVAGSFSTKKYVANQENINKYFQTRQRRTFLDIAYEDFEGMETPDVLKKTTQPNLPLHLPSPTPLQLQADLPIFLYTFYNMDATWRKDEKANRILLIEPSHFEKYPISPKSFEFLLGLGKNIPNLQIFVGELRELMMETNAPTTLYYKSHPTLNHVSKYKHVADSPEFIFPEVSGYHPSFFGYWKKCERYLKKWI